jgi:hypothetical protein
MLSPFAGEVFRQTFAPLAKSRHAAALRNALDSAAASNALKS